MTHDYKRHGTTTLFAAIDVLEGKVIGRCMLRHRHQEFIRFLNTIEAAVPVGKVMHIILDNYATHKHPNVKAWLDRHPRFVFHFTPTSCSWLNAVEGFFAKLTRRRQEGPVRRDGSMPSTASHSYLHLFRYWLYLCVVHSNLERDVLMARGEAYLRLTTQAPNPVARFAHNARHKLALKLVLQELRNGGSVLDFGCGPGVFLKQLATIRPDAKLFGYDPEGEETATHFMFIKDLQKLPDHEVDVITCLEVYEHMYKHEHEELWIMIKRLLTPGGHFIMSVPIIGSPILLLKQMNKLFYPKQPEKEYSIKELLLASFFGIPAKPPNNPRRTHRGFDFRTAERDLVRNCTLTQKLYSPFTSLPWYFNSQVFLVAVPAI